LDRGTGRLRSVYSVGSPIESSPIVRDGVDYFGAWNGRLYAFDLRRRRLRWSRSLGAKITSSASIAGGTLYIGDYAGRLWALRPRSGSTRWVRSVNGRIYGTPAVAGGRVFVPSSTGGSLTAFSARGRYLWRLATGSYVYSSPAASGGRGGDGCPRREGRTPRDHARGAGALGQAGGRAGLPRLGHARPARRLDAADAACERDRVAALAADAAVELVHVSPRAHALLAARAEPLLLRDPPVALHPRRRRGRRRGRVLVVSEARSRVSSARELRRAQQRRRAQRPGRDASARGGSRRAGDT